MNTSLLAVLVRSEPFESAASLGIGTLPPLPQAPVAAPSVDSPALRRPRVLLPLYVSYAALQGLDVHSTLSAVEAGRREANPVVDGLVSRPGALLGVKLAATAGTLFVTERLWKKHRGAAVALMVGVNVAYAAIVANNYRAPARR